MVNLKKSLQLALIMAPFALSACGEGWVAVYSNDIFPYGNDRTAGSGVTYVRQSMLPPKELKIVEPEIVEPMVEPVMPEPAPVVESAPKEPDPVHDAFMDAQAK